MNQTNTSKRIPTQINEFRGDYAFLSNFYPAPISYMGQTYANNEAAFQAQKTLSAREQRKFCMKELWNGFPTDQKPKWVTWEQLLQYEKVMTETGIPVKNCSD